ncbi:MAG: hypothetical protein IKQ55_05670 [Kiritimatiellae bacterium]|nr:hypothetical protein [Kiritimatiellia bacterium]
MVGKFIQIFPMIGKIIRPFSNDWKKVFQPLENFFPIPFPPLPPHAPSVKARLEAAPPNNGLVGRAVPCPPCGMAVA